MTPILGIVMLTGASCVSPVERSDVLNMTVVGKVPCAVVIRQPVGNPFKAAQEANAPAAVTPAAGKVTAFKYPPKKKKVRKKRRAKR